MKVKVKNFQNIKEEELEIDGFTTVVGKSNIGKSSIVRAIQGAIQNKGGDDFVRTNYKYSEVEIECPEISLIWRKGGGKNEYEVDGDLYQKVGHGSPSIIREKGFGEIETDRAKVNPQIASQFSPIFLINTSKTSGSVAAEIISDIGRLSDVQSALKDASQDRREAENTLKIRKEDLEGYKKDIRSYQGLDNVLEDVDKISDLREEIKSLQEEIQNLEYLEKEKDRLENKIDCLSSLDSVDIPDLNFEEEFSEIQNLIEMKNSYHSYKEKVEDLEGVEDVDISSTDEHLELLKELEDFVSIQEKNERLMEKCDELKEEVECLNSREEKIDSVIQDLFQKAGQCPMCETEVK